MSGPKVVFYGNVGQVIEGDRLKVSSKITMGPDGEMIVESDVSEVTDVAEEE